MISPVAVNTTQPITHVATVSAVAYSAPVQSSASSTQFAATYPPQVYAVYLNGLSSGGPSVLETDVYAAAVTQPGDTPPEIPSLPPIDGSQQVIQALSSLAGSGRIFSGAPAQTVAAGTGAVRSSASHSFAHVATR